MIKCARHALGRTLSKRTSQNISWCRYASSQKKNRNSRASTEQNWTMPKSQSLIMEQMLTEHKDNPEKSTNKLTSLDAKLAELDQLIKHREKAYQSYMEELERGELETYDENTRSEEESGKYVEEVSLQERTKIELSRSKVGSVLVTGTPDPTVPISDIPCPGCGAMLQCQKSRMPGFIASEVRKNRLYITVLWKEITVMTHSWSWKGDEKIFFRMLYFFFLFSKHLFYIVWGKGTKPILTPNDGQCQFSLSGIRTCDHRHASYELYHCATSADDHSIPW